MISMDSSSPFCDETAAIASNFMLSLTVLANSSVCNLPCSLSH